eukprot:314296-Pyramimonas_sp.AAC.1
MDCGAQETTEEWLKIGRSLLGQPLRGVLPQRLAARRRGAAWPQRAALRARRDRLHWPPLRLRPPGRSCCV